MLDFEAKVILDSISEFGARLTTVQLTYPRFIHSEVLTHRDRARNSASSRAIPWKRKKKNNTDFIDKCMYSMVMNAPVVPISFGMEQNGMQSGDEISFEKKVKAQEIWLNARDAAVGFADQLAELGVHKSIVNRLVEPFMWITVVMTSTEWKNFFRLRCHPQAEKHFQKIAVMCKEAINNSEPQLLKYGQWHLPYVNAEFDTPEAIRIVQQVDDSILPSELSSVKEVLKRVSVARCARVSYLTHDGIRSLVDDLALAQKLLLPPGSLDEDVMHASPFEHVARPSLCKTIRSGPFMGWIQYRKEFLNENVIG